MCIFSCSGLLATIDSVGSECIIFILTLQWFHVKHSSAVEFQSDIISVCATVNQLCLSEFVNRMIKNNFLVYLHFNGFIYV